MPQRHKVIEVGCKNNHSFRYACRIWRGQGSGGGEEMNIQGKEKYRCMYDAKSAHLIFPCCPFSPPHFPFSPPCFPSSPPRFPSFSPRFLSFMPHFLLPHCVIIYIMYDFFFQWPSLCAIFFLHTCATLLVTIYMFFFMCDFFGGKDKKTIILEIVQVWNVWQP